MIKRLAGRKGTDWEISNHAMEEMNIDQIDLLDIRNSLINASSAKEQDHDGSIVYAVTGKDTNDRTICAVVEIEEEPAGIFVITVWRVGGRR
ncbi:MAG TPA: DUF4258 domain-containing protein [Stellaceae bacterium]|nr:DUF4258 domain-containing protein [Stellaceae bacterium]